MNPSITRLEHPGPRSDDIRRSGDVREESVLPFWFPLSFFQETPCPSIDPQDTVPITHGRRARSSRDVCLCWCPSVPLKTQILHTYGRTNERTRLNGNRNDLHLDTLLLVSIEACSWTRRRSPRVEVEQYFGRRTQILELQRL